jgi:hypothetical protein
MEDTNRLFDYCRTPRKRGKIMEQTKREKYLSPPCVSLEPELERSDEVRID